MAELLEVVELRVASDGWPARTVGTVVEVHPDGALVEVADEDGRTLDMLSMSHADLRPRPRGRHRLPA